MLRAKIVLDMEALHRGLGLDDDVRVVMVHVTRDPDKVHVTVEGEGVPAFPLFGGDMAVLAAKGLVDSPQLAHPYHEKRIVFGGWKLGETLPTVESAEPRLEERR